MMDRPLWATVPVHTSAHIFIFISFRAPFLRLSFVRVVIPHSGLRSSTNDAYFPVYSPTQGTWVEGGRCFAFHHLTREFTPTSFVVGNLASFVVAPIYFLLFTWVARYVESNVAFRVNLSILSMVTLGRGQLNWRILFWKRQTIHRITHWNRAGGG